MGCLIKYFLELVQEYSKKDSKRDVNIMHGPRKHLVKKVSVFDTPFLNLSPY